MHDAASAAQEKASEVREQGSTRLRDQFDERSNQAGSQVRSLADALRRSGDDLSNEGNTSGARVAGQAADRIERVGTYLEQKSGDEVMREIETFARSLQDTEGGPRFASVKIDSANLERVLSSRDGTFIVNRIRGSLGFSPI